MEFNSSTRPTWPIMQNDFTDITDLLDTAEQRGLLNRKIMTRYCRYADAFGDLPNPFPISVYSIADCENQILVKCVLPGISKNQVQIKEDYNGLTITASSDAQRNMPILSYERFDSDFCMKLETSPGYNISDIEMRSGIFSFVISYNSYYNHAFKIKNCAFANGYHYKEVNDFDPEDESWEYITDHNMIDVSSLDNILANRLSSDRFSPMHLQGVSVFPTDIYVDQNKYVLECELPGVAKNEIQVISVGKDLVIRTPWGQKFQEPMLKDSNGFYRRFALPNAAIEHVRWKTVNGLLSVYVPLRDAAPKNTQKPASTQQNGNAKKQK